MAGILEWLTVAGTATLSVRLFLSGLYREYRAFFCYMVFATVRSAIFASLNPAGKTYYHIWVQTEPVEWLFYVLVVLELYSLVLKDYRGLSTAARWALIAAVGLALLASALFLLAPSHYSRQGPLMTYYYLAERTVYLSLLVFLLTMLGVLLQYPITLTRNIIVHSVVFSIYFLANTAIYLMLSLLGSDVVVGIGHALSMLTIATLVVWLAMLTPAGELRKQRLRPAWMPGREEELVNQLNQLNAALLRAGRR